MHPWLFRWGRFGLPTRGACAAIGIIAAMAMGHRVARRSGVDPEKFWDLGFFAVITVFVLSRLELVLVNWKVFLQSPAIVLALPTVSTLGLLLTALICLLYMRRNGMHVLKTLDAAGICATLLLVFVHLGDFLSGDDVGLATLSFPGRLQRGQGAFAHVGLHPVALYAALASLLIFFTLLWFLPRRGQAGEVFGLALGLGAIARFWVDCYRMETIFEIATPFGLDPDQVVMVVVMLVAAAFWLKWPTKKQENAHAL
ncbi:hypothetical protein FTW19_03795 [Terriglobus albidus]|uniref:Prolipoprotein diacylglyceryl transferase n=1 Tax=Terriglobus albidus TaxID=1592106 RepID=A0A5B9E9V1_9BACT|nr:prolipoprotein diacylglyceryl transferase family protein [Terriglobus albidus]QEE27211.1 hypothetical protein FTW19_03795 [Terriglobus albidus]